MFLLFSKTCNGVLKIFNSSKETTELGTSSRKSGKSISVTASLFFPNIPAMSSLISLPKHYIEHSL